MNASERQGSPKAFAKELEKAVFETGKVQAVKRSATVEIRDINTLSEEADVKNAVDRVLAKTPMSRTIMLLKAKAKGQRTVLVKTSKSEAKRLKKME